MSQKYSWLSHPPPPLSPMELCISTGTAPAAAGVQLRAIAHTLLARIGPMRANYRLYAPEIKIVSKYIFKYDLSHPETYGGIVKKLHTNTIKVYYVFVREKGSNMFAVIATFTNSTEVCLHWWGSLSTCESNAAEARTYPCYKSESVQIVEIEDFIPTGTTADDLKVWDMLDAMGLGN